MMGNLSAVMGFLQSMTQRIEELQARLSRERIEAAAAGGLARCTVNGLGEFVEVKIDGTQLGLDEAKSKQLQDAVSAAFRGAHSASVKRREQVQQEAMGELAGGLR